MMVRGRSLLVLTLLLAVPAASCSAGDGVGLLGAPLPVESGVGVDGTGSGGSPNVSDRYVTTGGVTVDTTAVAPESIDGLWAITVTDLTGVALEMNANVSVDALTVAHWTGFVQLIANSNASAYEAYHQAGSVTDALVANHMSIIDMGFGIIPYQLSGTWYLSNDPDNGHACESTLSPTAFDAHCNEVFPPAWIGHLTDGRVEGTKTSELASSFGQLGGEWQLQFSSGGTCVARFEHTTMGLSCTGTGRLDGTSALTFNGDAASGYTARGVEFSAVRAR